MSPRETDATKLCEDCGGRRDRGSRARAPGRSGEPWAMEACAHAEGDRHRRQVILTAEAHEGRFLAAGDHIWRRRRHGTARPAALIAHLRDDDGNLAGDVHPVPGRLLAAGVSGVSSMLVAVEVEELLPGLLRELNPRRRETTGWWEVLCLHASVEAVARVQARRVPWWRAIRDAVPAVAHGQGLAPRFLFEALPRWVVG